MYISRHFAQDDNNVILLQTKPLNSRFHENILLYHQKIMNQIFFRRGGDQMVNYNVTIKYSDMRIVAQSAVMISGRHQFK